MYACPGLYVFSLCACLLTSFPGCRSYLATIIILQLCKICSLRLAPTMFYSPLVWTIRISPSNYFIVQTWRKIDVRYHWSLHPGSRSWPETNSWSVTDSKTLSVSRLPRLPITLQQLPPTTNKTAHQSDLPTELSLTTDKEVSSAHNLLVCTISYLFPDLPHPHYFIMPPWKGIFLQNQICGMPWEQDYLALGLCNAFLVCLLPRSQWCSITTATCILIISSGTSLQ